MVKQAGELEAQSSEVQAQEENKPFSPIYSPSIKVNINKELMRKLILLLVCLNKIIWKRHGYLYILTSVFDFHV